jgi:hypothetical protein
MSHDGGKPMKKLLIFGFFFFTLLAEGQKITITAKVTDAETGESLGFASVSLKGKPIGTITNEEGDFDFHIPTDFRNDLLVISMMGYESYEAPAWTLLDGKDQIIKLRKSILYLDEVVVSETLKGSDILQIALSSVDKNYPTKPYMMEGFYRDLKKMGGTYISLLEAAVKIYDENYSAPRNKFKLLERVNLVEVRRSLGYGNKFTDYFDEDNLLEELLLNNTIRYRQFPEEEEFFLTLKRGKDSYSNGRPIYVITSGSEYYSLTLFIDKKNYGIIHLEYEKNQEDALGKRRGLESKFASVKKIVDFKSYQGKMYLNYITVDSKINWYDIKTKHLQFETTLRQQLLVNEVHPNTAEWIGTTKKMKDYGLQYQDLPYNKTFWDNYNVIKESPLEKKIVEDLERVMPLEKQFQN